MEQNMVGWFELPVKDMERAMAFYKAVFGCEFERHKMEETDMAWFMPFNPELPGAAGSLVHQPDFYMPSDNGTLVYFTAPEASVDLGLQRAREHGGSIVMEKISIGEHGFVGYCMDSEGNRIALHSMKE